MLAVTLSAVMAMGIAGCGSSGAGAGAAKSEEKSVVIGSKDFTENEIVAEIYALALEDAGFTVERKMNIAGSVVHTSITSAEIDIYPEYTGTDRAYHDPGHGGADGSGGSLPDGERCL